MNWGPKAPSDYWLNCPNCGKFIITGTSYACMETEFKRFSDGRLRLSHAIRKLVEQNKEVSIGSNDLPLLIENTPIPNPQEQTDNLILWLGRRLKGLSDYVPYKPDEMVAVIGGWNAANVTKIIAHLQNKRLVEVDTIIELQDLSLTMEGWEHYQQLERGVVESRKAFMAMQYGDTLLDRIYRECFKPAVESTGFELLRLDERPKAGLIDNRMRVIIRTARFIVADLSHANLGAYWEAGFAEGLGRPVIYTCERAHFEKNKTHFDTNHCHTVLWSESSLEKASMELAATVRATLPTEAILEG